MRNVEKYKALVVASLVFFSAMVSAHDDEFSASQCQLKQSLPFCEHAEHALSKGEYERAAEYFLQIEQLEPHNPAVFFADAKTHGKLLSNASMFSIKGYVSAMREKLEKVLAIAPEHLAATHLLIEVYMMLPDFLGGDERKAVAMASALRQRDTLEGLIAEASVAAKQEKHKTALSLLEQAQALAPERLEIRFMQAQQLEKLKRFAEAMQIYLSLNKEESEEETEAETTAFSKREKSVKSKSLWQISSLALKDVSWIPQGQKAMTLYLKLHHAEPQKLVIGTLRFADLYLAQGQKGQAKALLNSTLGQITDRKLTQRLNNKIESI